MIRLLTICAAFITLTAAQCDAKTATYYTSLIKGEPVESGTAFMRVEAVEEVAVIEPLVVVEPEPPKPDCSPILNRGVWRNPCTGEITGYVE